MKMQLSLLFAFLVSVTLSAALDANCPDPNNKNLKLEDNTTMAVRNRYNFVRNRYLRNINYNGKYMYNMERSEDECKGLKFKDDDPSNEVEVANKKPAVSLAQQFIQLPVKKGCEPCPVTQHFLGRFYRRCYVIASSQQQVRYVTCNRRCLAPCMCSRSYCQRTAYAKVWFFSYCIGNGPLPGGYRPGLNFRYLWLPQDCTCVNV